MQTVSKQQIDFYRVVEKGLTLPPTVAPDFRWRVFECFCDDKLAYQQSATGIHYQALVEPSYSPKRIVMAFDGEPIFALEGNQVALDRLAQPIHLYQSRPL